MTGNSSYEQLLREHGIAAPASPTEKSSRSKWAWRVGLTVVAVLMVALIVSNVALWSQLSKERSEVASVRKEARTALAVAKVPSSDFDYNTNDQIARGQVANLTTCVNDFLNAFSHFSLNSSFQYHLCASG